MRGWGGKVNIIQNISNGSENEDISTLTTNYEVEVFGNLHKWVKKYKRYKDTKKKHVLVIVLDERLNKYFDKIVVYKKK